MNKELIQQRFAKNLSTYNENAKIQKRMAEKLVSIVILHELYVFMSIRLNEYDLLYQFNDINPLNFWGRHPCEIRKFLHQVTNTFDLSNYRIDT